VLDKLYEMARYTLMLLVTVSEGTQDEYRPT